MTTPYNEQFPANPQAFSRTDTVVIVLTTVAADAPADAIAQRLVEARLAACVAIGGPMTSVYRWRGTIEHAAERQLVIKTTPDRLAALEQRLQELHPYEVPEFIVLSAAASAAYQQWLTAETRTVP